MYFDQNISAVDKAMRRFWARLQEVRSTRMRKMTCPPGACLWTCDSTLYRDDGSGELMVADGHHYEEALAAGWSPAASGESVVATNEEVAIDAPPQSEDSHAAAPTIAEEPTRQARRKVTTNQEI